MAFTDMAVALDHVSRQFYSDRRWRANDIIAYREKIRIAISLCCSSIITVRISYLAIWSGGPGSGVGRKLLAQAQAWQAEGHEVHLSLLTRDPAWKAISATIPVRAFVCPSARALPSTWPALMQTVDSFNPELLYVRQTIWVPGLASLMRRHCSVMEIQTDDVQELALHRWKGWWNRWTRRWVLDACTGFVFMTGELSQRSCFSSCGQPRAVVANPVPAFGGETASDYRSRPRLLYIGTPGQTWHGEDLIIRLASALPEYDFDMVGTAAPQDGPQQANIVWHGWLEREQYHRVFSTATVGLGSLGLHRLGMVEACPLKVREYWAHGLPAIIGYQDTDFPNGAPFLLRLPAHDQGVEQSITEVRAFVQRWHGRRFDASLVDGLRVQAKERLRLAFFQQIVNGRSA